MADPRTHPDDAVRRICEFALTIGYGITAIELRWQTGLPSMPFQYIEYRAKRGGIGKATSHPNPEGDTDMADKPIIDRAQKA